MQVRRFSIGFRVVLAVTVPVLALLMTVGLLLSSARTAQAQADEEAARIELLGTLAVIQSANIIPELAEFRRADPNSEGPGASINDYAWVSFIDNFAVEDDVRSALPAVEPFINAQELEAFENQRVHIEEAGEEFQATGTLSQQTINQLTDDRLDADYAFFTAAQRSSSNEWLVYTVNGDVTRTALIEGTATLLAIVGDEAVSTEQLEGFVNDRAAAIDRSLRLVDPSIRDRSIAVIRSQEYQRWLETIRQAQRVSRGEEEPAAITAVLGDLEFLDIVVTDLGEIMEVGVAEALDDVSSEATEARAAQQRYAIGLAVLLAVTALSTWWILRSITTPLRLLIDRATTVARGDIHGQRLTLQGGDELTRLNTTIEDLVDGLRHVDRQVRAVATGALEDPSLGIPAPGAVGAFIQEQIEALRTTNSTLRVEATRDELTGLFNRRGLLNLIEARAQAGSVLYFDLDGFKQVNDTHGHDHGDAVLCAIGDRIRASMRSEDLVARIGGDEFVVVTNGVQENIDETISRIQLHLQRPIIVDGIKHHVGCSIGNSDYQPGEGIDPALRRADQSMLQAKLNRGNRRRPSLPRGVMRPIIS